MSPVQRLGHYRIEAFLGEGAYARVYKAVDERMGRSVALKVLKPIMATDAEALERFLREARLAGDLFHQRLAVVLDAGEDGGRYYLAMRYVDGPNLAQVLAKRGPLPWPEVLRLTQQIAEGLAHLHERGMVHRDLKPQNVLLEKGREVVLTDFGLVRALHSSGLSTKSSAFVGTPAYIPPEVWEGHKATPAADQYALACIVVEMLTGKVLYDGPTTPAVMRKHFGPPPLPKTWPAGVPAGVENVLRKALAQQPEARYADVQSFVQALREAREGNAEAKRNDEQRQPPYRQSPPQASRTPPLPENNPDKVAPPQPPPSTPQRHAPGPTPTREAKPHSRSLARWVFGGMFLLLLIVGAGLVLGRSRIALTPTSTVVVPTTLVPQPSLPASPSPAPFPSPSPSPLPSPPTPTSLALLPPPTLSQVPTEDNLCPPVGSPEAMFAQPLEEMGTLVGSVGTGIFSHVVRPFGTQPTSYRYVRDALNERRCVQYLTPSVLSDPTQSRHCMTSFYNTNRIWVGSTLAGTLIWYKAAADTQYQIIGRMDRIPPDSRAYLVDFEIQPGDEICLGAPEGKRLKDIIQAAGYHLWIGRDLATYIDSWCLMLENDGSQHWCQ